MGASSDPDSRRPGKKVSKALKTPTERWQPECGVSDRPTGAGNRRKEMSQIESGEAKLAKPGICRFWVWVNARSVSFGALAQVNDTGRGG